ncbi:MAG: class I SAM-dependent methyltransferase [Chloroflexota bacterium]
MNVTISFWDRAARTFEQQEARYPHLHARLIENTCKYLSPTDLTLDFGCATGIKTLGLAGHVRTIQGIDISPKMIAAARQNAEKQKIGNARFLQATLFDPQFEPGSFDVILAFGVLHLLNDLTQALHQINHLLKPGGWFISSTACMGQDTPVLNWINRLISIPAQIGLLPPLRFLKIPELETAMRRHGFAITEAETIPFNPADGQTAIVARFVAAQKPIAILASRLASQSPPEP